MKTMPQNSKRPLLFAAGLACLIAITACETTTPHATEQAPFVISFEFLKPLMLPQKEVNLFEKALNKYAIPSLTRIRENGHLIWPLDHMKMTKSMKAEGAPSQGPVTDRPTKTDASQSGYGGGGDTNRPTKTDVVAFANQVDLRNFLNCIQGNGCPGGNN